METNKGYVCMALLSQESSKCIVNLISSEGLLNLNQLIIYLEGDGHNHNQQSNAESLGM